MTKHPLRNLTTNTNNKDMYSIVQVGKLVLANGLPKRNDGFLLPHE